MTTVAVASTADVHRAVTGRPRPVWRWRLAEGSGARATRRPPESPISSDGITNGWRGPRPVSGTR